MTRKPSLKQVACHIHKKAIAALAAERAGGVKPGSTGYLPVFQGAVTALMESLDEEEVSALEAERESWTSKGHPEELKRKAAENNGQSYHRTSAETQYREMGMRPIIWEHHRNKAGDSLVQM